MKHTYLHNVLPFLRELEREKQKQFEAYFRTAPLWLMDLFQNEVMEAKLSCASLLEEERRNRLYLFLDGADRLAVLFSDWFEKHQKNDILYINESRQNLADETGLCLKSISRAIKKFQSDGLITKKRKSDYG